MRVLFIIPRDPPPSLEGRGAFSDAFKGFVGACLQKDPAARPTTEALTHHPFITGGWALCSGCLVGGGVCVWGGGVKCEI
jgi:serine/threonine protein kinase